MIGLNVQLRRPWCRELEGASVFSMKTANEERVIYSPLPLAVGFRIKLGISHE